MCAIACKTHPHADHLDTSHFLSRSPGYGVVGAPCLNFYASPATLQRVDATFTRDMADFSLLSPRAENELNLKILPVEPFRPCMAGDYRVTAFPANHAPGQGAMLYAVESAGRTIFYGADTSVLFEETWQAFHRLKLRFDLVMLDHTYGPRQPGSDHMSASQVVEHAQRLRAEGLLQTNARIFATHIAHEGNPPHPELVAYASQRGYEVAYDGLKLEV
jgi:phosphoribosyl 1,2-cyclic phosphate phosphodiesterase